MSMIRVQPARHLRREFARWAVAQTPKLRTVSETEFGVPAALFTAIPEALLTEALVDGRPYVVPGPAAVPWEGDSRGQAPPPTDGEAEPGRDVEPVIEHVIEPVPAGEAGLHPEPAVTPEPTEDTAAAEQTTERYPCGICERTYATEGRASAHRRQAHTDTEG